MKITFFQHLFIWFRLFRWKNLFIIALTMILLRYALIHPLLGNSIQDYPLSHFHFFLLVLSIVFIAAAGYVINDYFDVKIDRINRPETMILGRYVSFSFALTIHQILSALGIILGFYLGYKVGSVRIGGIQAIMVALLWYYSYKYKALLIWGNFVVALLSGMTILLVWLFEFYSLQQNPLTFGAAIPGFKLVNKFIISYFLFSFIISFAREIVKDVDDIKGDANYNCKTIAVKYGPKKALILASILLILVLFYLIILQISFLPDFSKPLLLYSVLLLDIPLLGIIVFIIKSTNTVYRRNLSRYIKLLMLSGILSMIFITL